MAMIMGQLLHKVFQATIVKCQELGEALRGEALHQLITEEARSVLKSLDCLEHL